MRLIVNGEMIEVRGSEAPTLASLMSLFDYSGVWLATAVNGELVPRTARESRAIKDGDRIEILTPLQGG